MRKSNLERVRESRNATKAEPRKVDGLSGLHELLLGGPPNPTQTDLIADPDPELAYMGMVGAAKTSAICSLGWLMVLLEPGYKLLVGRKDFNDLKDTTLKRMDEMLHRLPAGTLVDRDKSAPIKWYIKPPHFGDEPETDEISEITFMGLHERPSSYEFNGAIVDEADELDKDVFDEVRSRCRLKGKTRKIAIAFNPTDEDHWIYTECTGLNFKGEKVQDPGLKVLVPRARENSHNLIEGYYENLAKRMAPDMALRLIEGKWGSSIKGTPVYGSVFKRQWHAFGELDFNPEAPLIRFHDFGYNHPFTIWAQPTFDGGLNVLWELDGKCQEIHERAPLIISETATRFPDAKTIIDWGDPAARQHKDTGSTLGVLLKNKIMLRYNVGVGIDGGIRAVRQLMSRTRAPGMPALMIDRRCAVLIRSLEKGYRYPDENEAGDPTKPRKDHYYDDPADAFRYGVVGLFGAVDLRGDTQEQETRGARGQSAATPGVVKLYNNIPSNLSYDPRYDPPGGHRK